MPKTPPRVPRRTVIIDENGNLTRPPPQRRYDQEFEPPYAKGGHAEYDVYDGPDAYSDQQNRRETPRAPNGGAAIGRPWYQKLLLSLAERTGYIAAWPIRLLAGLIEQGVNTLGYLLRLMLILMVVPAILMLSFQFAMAESADARRGVARNAMLAVGDTVAGMAEGVKLVFQGKSSDESEETPSSKKGSGR